MNEDYGPTAGALAAFQGGKFAGCALVDLPTEDLGLLHAWTHSSAVKGRIKRLHQERRRKGKGCGAAADARREPGSSS